jgi:hypothetical protein
MTLQRLAIELQSPFEIPYALGLGGQGYEILGWVHSVSLIPC